MTKTNPTTKYALLGAMMSGPRHGYEILRFLHATLGSTWHVSTSQLYVLLKKLESNELLTSSMETQETRPSKRIFALTTKGRKHFLDWLHSPTEHVRDLRVEFLAKLFFFMDLPIDGADRLVFMQIEVLQRIGSALDEKLEKEKAPYKRLVLEFKAASLNARLKWLMNEALSFAAKCPVLRGDE